MGSKQNQGNKFPPELLVRRSVRFDGISVGVIAKGPRRRVGACLVLGHGRPVYLPGAVEEAQAQLVTVVDNLQGVSNVSGEDGFRHADPF